MWSERLTAISRDILPHERETESERIKSGSLVIPRCGNGVTSERGEDESEGTEAGADGESEGE